MKRVPLVATALAALAVAAMIGLGVWQIRRADWKTQLIATYEANRSRPPVAWPALLPKNDAGLLYRRATGFCLQPVAWREVAGRNRKGEAGWSHIASCRTGGAEGPGMEVDAGWSTAPGPPHWAGGPVSGTIVPDRRHRIRLVADQAAPGLQPSAPTAPRDVPNNHMAYAVQWFLFALTAAIIYVIALRRRQRGRAPSG
jgi:cytochrome oxidase assembly protein ShyY1